MYRARPGSRGMGVFDVGTAGACGFTDLGVLKGECWCLSVGQTLCDWVNGPGSYVAALATQAPDVAYPQQPLPPAPQAVTNFGVSETVPPTVDQAQAAIDASIAAQKAAQNQQNQDYFNQVAAALNALGKGGGTGGTPNPFGLSTTALIAIGLAAGIGLLVLTSGGRRRR